MSRKAAMSRRGMLKAAGAGFAVTTLAGCLGNGDADTIRYLSRGGTTQDAEREIMEQWSEESGIDVEHQEAADDTEMMNIIDANPGEIDFTNPASWGFAYNELEFDGELLADFDIGEVPAYEDVIQDEWNDAPMLQGHDKGVFYYISSQGIGYNTEEADEITSWHDIKEPQYEDAVTLFDSGPGRFGNCAAALGYEPTEAVQDESLREEVFEEIEAQDENTFTYWSTGDEFMRLLREERAYVASAWGGRINVLEDDGHPMHYVIPDEGAVTWSNGWAVCEESENKDAAYDFINWLYDDEDRVVELATSFNYPIPIEDPPEEITQLYDYVDHPDDLAWIDWTIFVPHLDELDQRLAEIQAG